MKKILLCWVGFTDLRAIKETVQVGLGPIAQALKARQFDEVILISDQSKDATEAYIDWLKNLNATPIALHYEKLSGPTNFGDIYEAAVRVLTSTLSRFREGIDLVFHLSPGSPAMAAVWIILAKTRFPAELIESEFFGHEKGAFTGADRQHKGYFENANGGVLFFDAIGELPTWRCYTLEGQIISFNQQMVGHWPL